MKNQRGITLTSLIIYLILIFIIIVILARVSTYFTSNMNEISKESTAVSEIDKFNMFFLKDTKETMKKIKLKGVNPDHWYKLVDADGINGATRVKGSELLNGYDIYLEPRTSSLIWIEPLNKKGE